jgi:hypothetical protein
MRTACVRRAVWAGFLTALLVCGGCAITSDPLSNSEISEFAAQAANSPRAAEELPNSALDLPEALARAVTYNADIKVQEHAAALADARVRAQNASLLPSIVAESALYGRSKPGLSHSSLSPVYATSADLKTISSDLTLSWNILDFGLSYFRSLQAGDKAAREKEELRRVVGRVIEETRAVYWRAVAFQNLNNRLSVLDAEVQGMLRVSSQAGRDDRLDPLLSLSYDRDMLNMLRELNLLLTSLAGAPQQLKQLIGVPQDFDLRLRPSSASEKSTIALGDVQADVTRALENRYELRQMMYDARITDNEVYTTILQLLPGISLSRGLSHDTTSYLLHSNWLTWGTKVAWNLINLVHLPRDLDVVEMQKNLNRQQALAVAVSIAMQVHMSRARIATFSRTAGDANTFAIVQRKLLHQVRASAKVGKVAPQLLTKERLATLLSDIRANLAHADLQSAIGTYRTSMGQDNLAEVDVTTGSIRDIAEALRAPPGTKPERSQSWTTVIKEAASL